MTKKIKEDDLSYQELKTALDDILTKLQHPDTDIDEAMALHAEGQNILARLDTYLQKIAETAEISIKKIG